MKGSVQFNEMKVEDRCPMMRWFLRQSLPLPSFWIIVVIAANLGRARQSEVAGYFKI